MKDECLLALYGYLIPEARTVFDTLAVIETGTMEQIMLEGKLKTQQTRKGVWGLTSTGLIVYDLGYPIRLSENGQRLVELLRSQPKPAGAK